MLEPSPTLSWLVLQNIYANSKNRYCLRPPREIQRYNRSGRRGFNWLVHYNIQQSISMHADDVSNVVCSKLANQTVSLWSKVHFTAWIHLSIFLTNLRRDRWSVTKCFSARKSTKRRIIAEEISPHETFKLLRWKCYKTIDSRNLDSGLRKQTRYRWDLTFKK